MRRSTILAFVVAVLLSVPATQASAEQLVKVNIVGDGEGEVRFGDPEILLGLPPLECKYTPPGPATGVCESEMTVELGLEALWAEAIAAPGSQFVKWTVQSGEVEGCGTFASCYPLVQPPGSGTGHSEITAEFACDVPGTCSEFVVVDPAWHLTLTKAPDPSTGEGTGSVSSKPKGVKCGVNCTEAASPFHPGVLVTLKAKPSKESTFVEWTGACSGVESLECTVLAEGGFGEETLEAIFTGKSKPIENPQALTVDKGESSGQGTVRAYGGLGCEADCWWTTVLYQGPPKAKTVKLKQTAAFGSEFVKWVGCDSEEEEGVVCLVTMETDRTVSAVFDALPNKVLTVNKSYETGKGRVISKPTGVKCGFYCIQAVAEMPEGAAIELKAKPAKEVEFVEWVGGDCDESTNPICIVTMNTNEITEAVFDTPSKALKEESAATLTVSKGEGTGFGTVKGTGGLGCEFLCTSTDVVYQGPTATKPGKTVTLKAISAPGSKAVEWEGCTGFEEEGAICLVTMEEDTEVVATFDELE